MAERRLDSQTRALEDAFFRREADAYRRELLRIHGEAPSEAAAEAETRVDPSVAARLAQLGIRADTLAALTLIPLVEVAWADGVMEAREREAVLRSAERVGVDPQGPDHGLLRVWLENRPEPALMEAWRSFIEAVCGELSVEGRIRLRDVLVGRAREVAEAAGGFLGLGRVAREEEEVLSELERAFRL